MTLASPPSMMIESIEQCRRGRCDGVIEQKHVQASMLPHRHGQGVRRRVRAWCEHCQVAYGLTRELRSNCWQPVGAVEILTGKELESFKRRLAFLNGDRQVAS